MFIINSIWEYFINFMEQVLFIIFIHTKLHKKANFKNQSFLMLLFLTIQFIVLCFMNQEEISSYITLLLSCILDIIYVLTFYRDNIIFRLFWGIAYSIICLIAEQLTFLSQLHYMIVFRRNYFWVENYENHTLCYTWL